MPKYFIRHDDGTFEELFASGNRSPINPLEEVPGTITFISGEPRITPLLPPPKTQTVEQKQLGVIMSLYVHPDVNGAVWIQVASIARKYPRLRVVVVVDVNVGVGLGPDYSIQRAVTTLKNQGVTVLGRVPTAMGGGGGGGIKDAKKLSLNLSKKEMTNWLNWYQNLDGFYFDFVPRQSGHEDYYRELDEFAKKQLGAKMTVAAFDEPDKVFSMGVPESMARTTGIDVFVIATYKSNILYHMIIQSSPWQAEFPRSRFALIVTGINATNQQTEAENFVRRVVGTEKSVGYVYLQTDSGARGGDQVFNNLSSLFEPTLVILDQIAHAEDPTRRIPEPNQPFTDSPATVGGGIEPQSRGDETGLEPPTSERDVFGVQKLYPDARGNKFQEWYFQQDRDVTKDKRLKMVITGEGKTIKRMQDGSQAWFVSGKNAVLYVKSESPNKRWLNTESTIYANYVDDLTKKKPLELNQYLFQFLARTGIHDDNNKPCDGACYKSRILKNGNSTILREFAHGFYSDNKAVQQATPHNLKGQWIGFKQVVYNLDEDGNDNTYVVIENWVDDNCTDPKDGSLVIRNNWRRVSRFMDTGNAFVLRDGKQLSDFIEKRCKSLDKINEKKKRGRGKNRTPFEILNTPGGNEKEGNYVGFKVAGIMAKIANFSIRSIEEPRAD